MHYSLNRQVPTVFIPKSIAPAGKRAYELKPFELALIDCESGLSVTKAEYKQDRTYELVWKSPSMGANNSLFPDQSGAQLPIRSLPIHRIKRAHTFKGANDTPKPFVGYLGWDGISDCKTLNFECSKDYGLLINVRGEAVRNTFHRNMNEIIPFNTDCCDDCCEDERCDKTVDNILEAIQRSSFYVQNYFKVEKVKSCCPAEDPFDKKPFNKWTLEVCDDGSAGALAAVQKQYPTYDIECIGHDRPYSTYEVCIPCDPNAAPGAGVNAKITSDDPHPECVQPADYVQKRYKALECDNCPECPEGTPACGGDKLIVCFNAPAAAGVATFEEFEESYYADPMAAPTAIEALLVAAGGKVPGVDASCKVNLLGVDCDKLTVQVCVPDAEALKEHGLADITITHIGSCQKWCEYEAEYSWCDAGPTYKVERQMCLTLKQDDCLPSDATQEEAEAAAANILADVIAYYSDHRGNLGYDLVDISIRTVSDKLKVNKCVFEIVATQCSDCLEDGCDTFGKDGAKFDTVGAYKGFSWNCCACEGVEYEDVLDDAGEVIGSCPVWITEEDPDCLCGLKFTGAFIDKEILECTFAIDDNVEREPIEIEVSIISQYDDTDFNAACDTMAVDWTVVQYGTTREGDGRFVARQEILSREYELYQYLNPKQELGNLLQQRLGYAYGFNAAKVYNHISLYHDYEREGQSWHDASHGKNRELIKIFVEKGDPIFDELSNFFNATLLDNGVSKLL